MNPIEHYSPPPAAFLVANGYIASEQEFLRQRQGEQKIRQAERQRLAADARADELKKQNQEIRTAKAAQRRKPKRRYWLSPIIGAED